MRTALKFARRILEVIAIALPTVAKWVVVRTYLLNILSVFQVIALVALVWEAKSKKAKWFSIAMALVTVLYFVLVAVSNNTGAWVFMNDLFQFTDIVVKAVFGLVFFFAGTKKEKFFAVALAASIIVPVLGLPANVVWASKSLWTLFVVLLF